MGSSFEEAAFALVQAMSPSKRLSMEDIPFNSLKEIVGEFLGRKKREVDTTKTNGNGRRTNGKHHHHQTNGNGKVKQGDDDASSTSGQSKSNGDSMRRPSFSLDGLDDEDSRMSDSRLSAGLSEDSLTTNDEESRSSIPSLTRRKSSHTISSSYNSLNGSRLHLTGISLRQAKRAKRLQELREVRRKQAAHDDYDDLVAPDGCLTWSIFFSWWESVAARSEQSTLYCYHRAINTLRQFYSRHTWSTNVESQLIDFLEDNVKSLRKHIAGMRDRIGDDGVSLRVREAELLVMLEAHVLANRLGGPEKEAEERKKYVDASGDAPPGRSKFMSNLLADLRFIFTATDSMSMRHFLEETVTDTFVQFIPRTITELYEELCVTLPADLDEFAAPNASPSPSVTATPVKDFHRSESLHSGSGVTDLLNGKGPSKAPSGLDLLLQELDDQAPGGESTTSDERSGRSSGARGKRKHAAPANHDSQPSHADFEEPKPIRRRIVPETPEEKLRKSRDEILDDDEDVVHATPMAKLARGKVGQKAKRLSELVKLSEEQLARKPRAAAVASERASRAIIQAVSSSTVPATSKAAFLSLNTPSPRSNRAKTNLAARFAKAGTSSTPTTSGRAKKSGNRRSSRTHVQPERLAYAATPSSSSTATSTAPKKKPTPTATAQRQSAAIASKASSKQAAARKVLKKALGRGKTLKGQQKSKGVSSAAGSRRETGTGKNKKKPQKRVSKKHDEEDDDELTAEDFGITDEFLRKYYEKRERIIEADRVGGSAAVKELAKKLRQEEQEEREAEWAQRSRTGRLIHHDHRKLYVSHYLSNTYNHKKEEPNEPVCRNPNQFYFKKIAGENVRWRDIHQLEKRRLLAERRRLERAGKAQGDANGTDSAQGTSSSSEPKKEFPLIQIDDSDDDDDMKNDEVEEEEEEEELDEDEEEWEDEPGPSTSYAPPSAKRQKLNHTGRLAKTVNEDDEDSEEEEL